jgi:hypothetical protein
LTAGKTTYDNVGIGIACEIDALDSEHDESGKSYENEIVMTSDD